VSPRLELPLPARGSSGAATCPHSSGQHRGRHATCPNGSGQLQSRHVSLGLQHPPYGAGQLRSYHVSPGLCRLQANKQISSGDPAIIISIGAGVPISSKVLRDKGCSARSQGVQQVTH
jgi:hypothetical protein